MVNAKKNPQKKVKPILGKKTHEKQGSLLVKKKQKEKK